jgi:hypothetical protein
VTRKILGVCIVFMLVAMLATPVLAVSPKKISVTATQSGGVVPGPESITWTTEGGIRQFRDYIGAGTVTLNIPGQDPLTGPSSSVFDFTINTKTQVGVFHGRMTWEFNDGTFEGVDQMTMYYAEGARREAHMVLHGSDAFEGWVITLNGVSIAGVMNWEGFLLIP